ncbi:hypothetical protein FY553_18705 [Vibrio cholerae]|nr:hypothetical protein FY553_18705 [Vibrio cholerae]
MALDVCLCDAFV